jgi:hypothetical protein
MIANAISVFEQGYFDCAFYSLRQVIELSRTMIYLSDLNEDKKREEMRKWRAKARFPNQRQMMEFLEAHGAVFAELKDALQEYFEEYEAINMRLNKYVHKQGYDTFYFGRSTSFLRNEKYEDLEEIFSECIAKCISAVTVNRLAIDPLPLLLADDGMFRRTGDMMSDAFSDDFIEKYLGTDLVERYKTTEIYRAHYEHFADEEPMSDAVLHVVKDQYVITSQIEDILQAKERLSKTGLIAVLLFRSCEKIMVVYSNGGFGLYFSDRRSNSWKSGFDSRDLEATKRSSPPYNVWCTNRYYSYIRIGGEDFFIHHDEKISDQEYESICNLKQIDGDQE